MKKLFLLQITACIFAFFVGRFLGLELWQVALFGWFPIFAAGYIWLWWFRNIFFYRDPERRISEGDNLILSPADGRVMYVCPVTSGEVVSEKKGKKIRISELAKTDISEVQGWLVGIYMSPFDVHFCRAPIEGEITTLFHYQTGLNLPMVDLWEYVNFTLFKKAVDMFAARFHLENERMTMRIQNGKTLCFVILIADQFVNKIRRFFQDAQRVKQGEKICFIERGSQTDVFIPYERVSIKVKPGDQVYAGISVVGVLEN